MPPTLAAVVLNYQTPDDTVACVRSLEASRRPLDRVIVVDNGSADGSAAQLAGALPRATVIAAPRNLGFSGGCNLGVARALEDGADLVMLVNSDILLPTDCTGALEAALAQRPSAGIAGPAIVSRANPGRIETRGISFSSWSGRVWNHEFGRRHDAALSHGAGVRTVDGVSGALMLIKRAVFERVGPLEDQYFFSFEDLDFCLRARAAGFETICVDGATAHHEGGRSIGARSSRRIYFATRNHLLLARRVAPLAPLLGAARQLHIAALNLAYVLTRSPAPRASGLVAFVKGVYHHLRGRYGDGP